MKEKRLNVAMIVISAIGLLVALVGAVIFSTTLLSDDLTNLLAPLPIVPAVCGAVNGVLTLVNNSQMPIPAGIMHILSFFAIAYPLVCFVVA